MSSEHIRKRRGYESRLTNPEKKVLLWLSEQGPKAGYDLFAKDGVISNSTWKKVRGNLTACVLIDPLWKLQNLDRYGEPNKLGLPGKKEGAHQRVPYWLTHIGAGEALGLGADPQLLLRWVDALGLDPHEASMTRFLAELCVAAGPAWTLEQMNEYSGEAWTDGGIVSTREGMQLPKDEMAWIRMLKVVRSYQEIAQEMVSHQKIDIQTKMDFAQLLVMGDDDWSDFLKATEEKRQGSLRTAAGMISHLQWKNVESGRPTPSVFGRDIVAGLGLLGMSDAEARKNISEALRRGEIFEAKHGHYQRVNP